MLATRRHRDDPGWRAAFCIDGAPGGPIRISQVGTSTFILSSTIEYNGETGLEGRVPDATLAEIRRVGPTDLPDGTDLASIPGMLRWFAGPYGVHTPAALIHDRLIGGDRTTGMTDVYADRFFRFMLQSTGVHWLKRWLMWAAVALRSRLKAGRLKTVSAVLWVLLATTGIATLTTAVLSGNRGLAIAAVISPIPASALWARQFGAGLVAAYSFPWLLPPAIFAAVGYTIYLTIELTVTTMAATATWARHHIRIPRPARIPLVSGE